MRRTHWAIKDELRRIPDLLDWHVKQQEDAEAPWLTFDKECHCWVFDDHELYLDSRTRYEDVTTVYASDIRHSNGVTVALIVALCKRRAEALGILGEMMFNYNKVGALHISWKGIETGYRPEAEALLMVLQHAEMREAKPPACPTCNGVGLLAQKDDRPILCPDCQPYADKTDATERTE